MKKLISEQLPRDGGWHIDRLVQEANERLGQIGKRGKRAKIVAKKNVLTLQFTFTDEKGRRQRNPGLGCVPFSPKGVEEAEEIAKLVTTRLVTNDFSWEWFNKLIGKNALVKNRVLTCKEMIEAYKAHYFKQRKGNKAIDKSWYASCIHLERILGNLNQPLSLSLIRQVIDCTENNTATRRTALNGLVGFLKHFDDDSYKNIIKKYKADNKPKKKKRNIPTDKQITQVYKTGFTPGKHGRKDLLYRFPQWQFLYGLLAVYGLRIHEAWNIANWDKPVILKDGDWIVVDNLENDEIAQQHKGETKIIPAILDPENKDYILCIKHDTKTGYRMVAPISPEGHNWLEEFNLLQPFNIPHIKDALIRNGIHAGGYNCSSAVGKWFRKRKYGFTPHALRHAYVIRGHILNYNPKALADSAGHSMTMSSTTYTKHMSAETKYENLVSASSKKREKDSENELLKKQVEALTNENAILKNENEMLRAKLQIESLLAKQ